MEKKILKSIGVALMLLVMGAGTAMGMLWERPKVCTLKDLEKFPKDVKKFTKKDVDGINECFKNTKSIKALKEIGKKYKKLIDGDAVGPRFQYEKSLDILKLLWSEYRKVIPKNRLSYYVGDCFQNNTESLKILKCLLSDGKRKKMIQKNAEFVVASALGNAKSVEVVDYLWELWSKKKYKKLMDDYDVVIETFKSAQSLEALKRLKKERRRWIYSDKENVQDLFKNTDSPEILDWLEKEDNKEVEAKLHQEEKWFDEEFVRKVYNSWDTSEEKKAWIEKTYPAWVK